MNCPINRGGCGRKLSLHEGAFCDDCMAAAKLHPEYTRPDVMVQANNDTAHQQHGQSRPGRSAKAAPRDGGGEGS